MRELLSGAIAMGSLVVAMAFLKFWRRSNDELFALFAAAVAVFAANSVALGLSDPGAEPKVAFYIIRLVGFLLILGAIVRKNRSRSR